MAAPTAVPGEFYQLDLEMSFVTQDDVFAAIEPVLQGVFEEFADGRKVDKAPYPRIPYAEAMLKYGTDKPDLRNPILIADVSDVFARADVEFKAFKNKTVRAIPAPGAAGAAAQLLRQAQRMGARAKARRAWAISCSKRRMARWSARARSPNSFRRRRSPKWRRLAKVKAGDALFFAADKEDARRHPGRAGAHPHRPRTGPDRARTFPDSAGSSIIPCMSGTRRRRGSTSPTIPSPCRNMTARNSWRFSAADKDAILGLKAFQYDIVCNGYEMLVGRDPQPRSRSDAEGVRDRRLCRARRPKRGSAAC